MRRSLLAAPLEVNDAGDLAVLSIPFRGDIYEDASVQAIRDLREEYVPAAFAGTDARVLVGGETAFNVDFFNQSDTYMPIVFAFVLGLSFLLLTVVFRSVVLPVKAILMNLLSVGAAYGMVVMFFQEGVGPAVREGHRRGTELHPGRIDRGMDPACSCSPSCSGCRWTTTCSC